MWGIQDKIVLVHNLLFDRRSEETIIVYEKFRCVDNFYSYPLDSNSLGIYCVSVPRGELHAVSASEISEKYVLLPSGGSYVAIPEAHVLT